VKWYRSVGTVRSPGTKCFSLSGKVKNTGLVEVPIGTSLQQLIEVSAAAPKQAAPSRPRKVADLGRLHSG